MFALLISSLMAATPLPEGANCLWSKESPKNSRSLEIPLQGQSGEVLTIDWYMTGSGEHFGDLAAALSIRFSDGQELAARTLVGNQVSTSPVTGRDSVLLPSTVDGKMVYFHRQSIPLGRSLPVERVTITGRLSNQTLCVVGTAIGPAPFLHDSHTDTTGWYPFTIAKTFETPLPQAAPVRPKAGSLGFVRMGPDGHLQFEDGSRARFWGTNLMGPAALPEKAEAEAYARQLAQMGFDMVRIHHIDRPPFGLIDPDYGKPGHKDPFDEDRLDRLDWFIAKLREQGIYLWAEIATNRTFSEADGVSVPQDAPNGHKLYPMWEPDWQAAYLTWFEQFWGRTNPYTGLRYADDPAVAILELSNEHTLLMSWGLGIEQLHPSHLANLTLHWNDWLKARYGDDAAIAAAWKGSIHPGLQGGETLGTIAREPAYQALADKWPDQRRQDLLAFYWDLEENFYKTVAEKAKSMGFHVPMLPGISYNRSTLQVLQAPYPVTDIHINYDKGGDGSISGQSVLVDPTVPLNATVAAIQGKALAISELTHSFPNPFRAEAPWVWTTLGLLQGWDVLIWSFWAEQGFASDPQTQPNMADLRTNTVVVSQLTEAASAWRSGWIPELSSLFPVNLDREAIHRQLGIPELIRPLEITDLGVALSRKIRTTLNAPMAPGPATAINGVGWWTDPGVLLVDQPQLQVRVGPPGTVFREGAGITQLSGLNVLLDRFAAVSLVSGDGLPLSSSKLAMLTLATNGENTDMLWGSYGSLIRAPGVAPTLLAPARGSLSFRWSGTPIVEILGPTGAVLGTVPVKGKKGWWTLQTDTIRSPWLQIHSD